MGIAREEVAVDGRAGIMPMARCAHESCRPAWWRPGLATIGASECNAATNMRAFALSALILAPPPPQDGGAAGAPATPPTRERGPLPGLAPHEDGPPEPEDGWFDVSAFLERPHGFLPIVVPITEPALGYGALGGALFLDPREEAGAEGWSRPNMTMLGGLWTEGGSDGLFAANSSLWSGGDLQTLVGGGELSMELELHGIGEDPVRQDDPLDYRLEMLGLVGEGRQRLGDSDLWLALRFAFAKVEVVFDGPAAGIPGVDPEDDDVTLAGPALTLRHDSLDNLFTPTRGTLSDTSVSFFDDAFGGSRDFQRVQEVLIHHRPLSERFFLGARAQASASFGETPFYARPYISMRGIPALRYQGEHVLSAELELRWQFHPRFSLVGFGGAGLAWTNLESFDREQGAFAEGLGLRYLVARKFGLHAGLDVARGPEEGAIYVQFGNAWVRP